jgi:DivIVA domain-containing protein
MEWFIAMIAVAALGVAAIAAAGGLGEMSKNPVHDTYRQDLPETALTPGDIGQLKFGIALRGYAMNQVDDVLDRLAREIAERDARIAELTSASRPVLAHEPTVAPQDRTELDEEPKP